MRDRLPYRRPVPVSQVPPADLGDLAATVRAAHQGVMLAVTNMIEHALAAGDALIAAKAALEADVGYGHWLKWLKSECDLSEDRAERYMRVARGRAILEADSARVRNLSLTGALKLLPSSKAPPAAAQRRAHRTAKAPSATRHDAYTWWSAAPIEDRSRLLDGIGSKALADAIPPDWNMKLVPAGESVGRLALQSKRIGELEVQLRQRARTIEKLQRKLGPVFGVDASTVPAPDGDDGLDISACLRRAPANTSSAASGTPPALAAGSSDGGITTMRSE
jgi:hypothetical protein